jgi:hypothetical protein
MSSFSKNVLPRRAHRERLQPGRRVARHGLLEKKKDYKLRARDASRKKRRVKLLKEKAAFRNPDEFYHAMEKGRTDAGVARRTRDGDGGHHVADGEVRRLVETQDRGYVRVKMARERARIEKGKAGLHFLEAAAADGRRRHTVFVGGGGGGDSDGDSDGGGGDGKLVITKDGIQGGGDGGGAEAKSSGFALPELPSIVGVVFADAAATGLRSGQTVGASYGVGLRIGGVISVDFVRTLAGREPRLHFGVVDRNL